MWLAFVGSWFSFLVQCYCLTVYHDLQLPRRLEIILRIRTGPTGRFSYGSGSTWAASCPFGCGCGCQCSICLYPSNSVRARGYRRAVDKVEDCISESLRTPRSGSGCPRGQASSAGCGEENTWPDLEGSAVEQKFNECLTEYQRENTVLYYYVYSSLNFERESGRLTTSSTPAGCLFPVTCAMAMGYSNGSYTHTLVLITALQRKLRRKSVAKLCEWPSPRSVSDSSRYISSRAQYAVYLSESVGVYAGRPGREVMAPPRGIEPRLPASMPCTSSVAAVCRRELLPAVVFCRVAGAWPMVARVCYSSVYF